MIYDLWLFYGLIQTPFNAEIARVLLVSFLNEGVIVNLLSPKAIEVKDSIQDDDKQGRQGYFCNWILLSCAFKKNSRVATCVL